MKDKTFVFAGNRYFVLEDMLASGLKVDILAVRGSYLETVLQANRTAFTSIESRDHLVAVLGSTAFDFFVANGCPYILPISQLQDGAKTFVNVHPSPLPELRGADPVPGALLLGRDSGATCHIMDDGIDTGPVISRVVVPNTDDLDAGLLYQVSFLAEKDVFKLAYERRFEPLAETAPQGAGSYYTRKDHDLIIDFDEPTAGILRRIMAFSNKSQGARFSFDGADFTVFDAEPVTNPYLMERRDQYRQNEIIFRYENCLLLRHDDAFLKLKAIDGDLSEIRVGDILGSVQVPTGEGPNS